MTQINTDIYQPRNPRASDYFRCTEAHFEELEAVWDDRYVHRIGFWRPYVMEVIHRYLDCGDLHCGFARVKRRQDKRPLMLWIGSALAELTTHIPNRGESRWSGSAILLLLQ